HLLVNQRLAARDRDDRCAALVDGAQRVLDAHALSQDLVRIVDLSAAGTSQIALEQRLKHQHERIPFVALELLLDDVARYPILLYERNAHGFSLISCPSGVRRRASSVVLAHPTIAARVIRPCRCARAASRGNCAGYAPTPS